MSGLCVVGFKCRCICLITFVRKGILASWMTDEYMRDIL